MIKYIDFFLENIQLNEDPENLLGLYPRNEYNSILFMGTEDGKGLIYLDISNLKDYTHSMMLRRFLKSIEDGDDKVRILGDVSSGKFMVEMSGAIMPKQKDIEKTLISIWDKKGLKLKDLISNLINIKSIPMPATLEITDMWNDKNTYTVEF